MNFTTEPERKAAICALLAQDDPPDLAPREHVLTHEGHPQRFRRYRYLGQEFVARQQIARMNERELDG